MPVPEAVATPLLAGDEIARLARLREEAARAGAQNLVKSLAREFALTTAEKPESMDLCFVAEGESYRDVLARAGLGPAPIAGEIVDTDGHVLAAHGGVGVFDRPREEPTLLLPVDIRHRQVHFRAGITTGVDGLLGGAESAGPAAHADLALIFPKEGAF